MRIACPACNAVYQVPDEQLGEGRLVRCARCGTDWSPVVWVAADGSTSERADGGVEAAAEVRPEALPEPPPETLPQTVPDLGTSTEPEPVRRMALDDDPVVTLAPLPAEAAPAVAAPVRRRGPWLAIAWIVSVLAVAGGVAALVVWREAVMQVWPPSIRAYVAAGLAARR